MKLPKEMDDSGLPYFVDRFQTIILFNTVEYFRILL